MCVCLCVPCSGYTFGAHIRTPSDIPTHGCAIGSYRQAWQRAYIVILCESNRVRCNLWTKNIVGTCDRCPLSVVQRIITSVTVSTSNKLLFVWIRIRTGWLGMGDVREQMNIYVLLQQCRSAEPTNALTTRTVCVSARDSTACIRRVHRHTIYSNLQFTYALRECDFYFTSFFRFTFSLFVLFCFVFSF